MSKYFALLLLLLGCGAEQSCQTRIVRPPLSHGDCYPEQVSPRIHPNLKYAIDSFSADALRNQVPCYGTPIVGFTSTLPPDVPATTIGYCLQGGELRVLTRFWQTASATERLTLMYHELGHCALGLEHLDGEPDIMNSYILDEITAEKRWEELVNKMMERAK